MSVRQIAEPYVSSVGGVITALRAVQTQHGYLPEETEAIFADVFNLSRAEILGIISFYSDFRREAPTSISVKVCAAEACQAVGGNQYKANLEKALEGEIQIEHVFCLGLCSVAPCAMIEDELIGRADVNKTMAAIQRQSERSK